MVRMTDLVSQMEQREHAETVARSMSQVRRIERQIAALNERHARIREHRDLLAGDGWAVEWCLEHRSPVKECIDLQNECPTVDVIVVLGDAE